MYTLKLYPAIQYYSITLYGFLLVPSTPTAFQPSHTPALFRYASAALSVWLRSIDYSTVEGGLVDSQSTERLLGLLHIVVLCHHFSYNRLIVSVVVRTLYFND